MRFHVYEDDAGEFRWRLVARNGRIIATSGEGYTRKLDAQTAARKVATIPAWTPIDNDTVDDD